MPLPVAAGAELVDHFIWRASDPDIGGLSGLKLAPGGSEFVAIGDRGIVVTGRLEREAGRIGGVTVTMVAPLRDTAGRPLSGHAADAEGLEQAPDGTLYVSFERDHRVVSYAAPGAPARPLPRHPGFARLIGNNGLEALAMDARGVLWAIAESSGDWTLPLPVFRYAEGRWTQPFGLPRRGPYLAVGAEFGPDGRLYLLERDFAGVLRGVSSRVRAFRLGPEGPLDEEEILVTPHGQFDNLEAIALWQEPDGALRITLLSDDNFNPFQRTEFVEFRVSPGSLLK